MTIKYIGAHVSAVGGVDKVLERAHRLKATALSFFVKNQLRWNSPSLSKISIINFKKFCLKYGYSANQMLPHANYLINLGHPDLDQLEKSRNCFIDELYRCRQLGLIFLNIHPGSHLNKISIDDCLERISESVNLALDKIRGITVVIENTSGQGSNVGYNFKHLSIIINNIKDKSRIGICLDTCHLFSSGYDLRTEQDCLNTFNLFDKLIGINYLKGLHLNDSKGFFNSRIDRHQSLGLGNIGRSAFIWIMKNIKFNNIPIILETINSKIWDKEISWLKSIFVKKY